MCHVQLNELLTRLCPPMNQHGHTALIAAATHGHAPVVKLLLDEKVIDVNRANEVSPSENLALLRYCMLPTCHESRHPVIIFVNISDLASSDT
jgi:ankyrin repeat protein